MRRMVSRYIGGNWCDPELEEPYDVFDYLGIDDKEIYGVSLEEPDEEMIEYPKELAEEDEEIERLIKRGVSDDR